MAALMVVTVAASAFAKEPKIVNSAAVNNFAIEYKKASDVNWSTTDIYVKATFVLNQQRMEAFYNLEGDKIGTSKAFNTEELPTTAKRALAKKFNGYTVSQSIEFQGTDETAYFISADNEKESVILKVNGDGNLSTFQRTKK